MENAELLCPGLNYWRGEAGRMQTRNNALRAGDETCWSRLCASAALPNQIAQQRSNTSLLGALGCGAWMSCSISARAAHSAVLLIGTMEMG